VHLAQVLPEFGVSCHRRQTVGDNLERLAEALRQALSRSDVVFTIGGLGPTEDDLTREAISAALEDPLVLDDVIAEKLRKLFAYRKLAWTESQLRQAMLPSSAEPIENPNGTAPGLLCRHPSGKFVIALPGPRGEFVPMVEGQIREFLSTLNTGKVIVSQILKTAGIGEAALEDRVRDLIRGGNPSVAPYAHPGEVHLRITASSSSIEEAERLIAPVESKLREILGDSVYGGEDDTLESIVVHELCRRNEKLAVAESCTGGGLGERITTVPGSSAAFVGGVISYANEIKSKLLGVSAETLSTMGAVSEECAREMAEGVCRALDAQWGISITGIAGPEGGSEQKPVGLVYIGVSGPSGTTVEEYRFRGEREGIRQRSVQMALIQMWKRLKS
jgi:nicotinamide-nucleotide amidase